MPSETEDGKQELDALVVLALDALEDHGQSGLDRVLRDAPEHATALPTSTGVCPRVSISRPRTGAPIAVPIADAAATAPPSAYECPRSRAWSTNNTPSAAIGNRATRLVTNSRRTPGSRSAVVGEACARAATA